MVAFNLNVQLQSVKKKNRWLPSETNMYSVAVYTLHQMVASLFGLLTFIWFDDVPEDL